jgi:hypothetical protein
MGKTSGAVRQVDKYDTSSGCVKLLRGLRPPARPRHVSRDAHWVCTDLRLASATRSKHPNRYRTGLSSGRGAKSLGSAQSRARSTSSTLALPSAALLTSAAVAGR